jgi:serine/threonine protein kinase
MAPEQWRGEQVDARTDLYAFGATLHILLTGAPPFPGPTQFALMHQHLTAPPPRLRDLRPDLPPELDDLLQRLLAKKPIDRPATTHQVKDALHTVLDQPLGPDRRQVGGAGSAGTGSSTSEPPGDDGRAGDPEHSVDTSAKPGPGRGWLRRRSARVAAVCVVVMLAVVAVAARYDRIAAARKPSPTPSAKFLVPVSTASTASTTTGSARPSPTGTPTTVVPKPTAAQTARPSTGPSKPGPVGPGSDPNYQADSKVAVTGCAGWLDYHAPVLDGVLSAGDASCAAAFSGIDIHGMPYSASLTTTAYHEAKTQFWLASFGAYKFTAKICIWNQNNAGHQRCSPTFTDTSGTITHD